MLQKVLSKQVKGSTLPEVLIALVILTFCTACAVLIYLNVQQSTMPFSKLKAAEIADKYLRQIMEAETPKEDEFKEEEYLVKCRLTKSDVFTGNTVIKVSVYNQFNKKLSEIEVIK